MDRNCEKTYFEQEFAIIIAFEYGDD